MKNLITYLKALWSWVADSQSTDVSFDCRLTVGSPSGDNGNSMLKLVSILVILYSIGSGNVWGAVTALTIPKAWGTSDGKSAYTEALGCSNTSCLGSDYSSAPKLKFDGQGDYIIIQIASAPAYVTFNIKGYPGSGSWSGTFKVQESSNGSTYTDAASYTSLSSSSTSKTVSLSSATRYIKFNFVTKSNGNVGLGGVTIKARTSVTLDKNGGDADGSAVFAHNATAYESFTTVTRTGYTLNGYYTASSAGTKVLNADGSRASSSISGWWSSNKWAKDAATAKLYAQWSAKTYGITLDRNGASSGSTSVTMTYNSSSHTALTAPTRDGYTFDGWYDSESNNNGTGNLIMNASGVLQANAGTYTGAGGIWILDDEVTLYAKWTAAVVCADPAAPSNGSVSSTGATITFAESGNYDIYYSTSSTAPTGSTPATTTVSSASSKALTGLPVGTTYYYWARKDCGGGSKSDYVAGDPTSFTTTVPAPTGLSMTPSLYGVTFGITDANNVNNYEIYYSTTNSAPGASPSGTATTTTKSKEVTGLPASTTYYCWVRAKGPNANSSWYSAGSFATLTLSSISVSTAPTKTKYLVGDNFDPTGLVITRTYSNSTSDTYSYAGHTSEFSFSPATNAALTALNTSVTITYGGQTASQAINVYTVTVNKVNMSGTAITADGVTASCSGRTLSQSVGSTNYKFEEYAVTAGGVTVSTNTITGTPTGNVTINAKFHDPITVTKGTGTGTSTFTISASEIKYNTSVTVTCAAAAGYKNQWTLTVTPSDGATYSASGSTTSITISNITKDITVDLAYTECTDHGASSITSTSGGNSYMYGPVSDYHKYSTRQILYTRSDLGLSASTKKGIIKSIYFYYKHTSAMTKKTDVKIYMANTHLSSLSTSSYVPYDAFTEVYSGSLNCTATNNWNEFMLDEPFEYNGTGNLVVMIDDNSGAYDGSSYTFYYHAATNAQIYKNSDSDNEDPEVTDWSEYSAASYRPSTKFCIQEADMVKATVNWYVNGEIAHSQTDYEGTALSGIPTPDSEDCDGSKVFVGWYDDNYTHATDAPDFVEPDVIPKGGANYYAVFANVSSNQTATFPASDLSGLTEDDTYWMWTHDASGIEFWIVGSRYTSKTPYTFSITADKTGYLIAPNNLLMTAVAVTITENTYKINSVSSGWTLTTDGTSQSITSSGARDLLMTATSDNQIRITTMTVTYKTCTNFATSCCTQHTITLASSGSVTGGTFNSGGLAKACATRSITLTATPSNSGYVFNGWTVEDGSSNNVTTTVLGSGHESDNPATMTMPDYNVTVTAAFSAISSISVKTAPTKTVYLEGETFDPTGLVITATYANSATVDVPYSGNEALFTLSPTTATALTTENASVSITYNGQTTSQSITVYSVTLQALDENGDAIRVGGPAAPTRDGTTVTKAANVDNYVYKEWVVSGATLADGANANQKIITDPTGAVTVTVKYYLPRVVKWMVNGEEWKPYTDTGSGTDGTAEVARGAQWKTLTLPTDPNPLNDEGCGDKFIGWTNAEISGQLDKDDDAAAISTLVDSNLLNSANKSGKTKTINANPYIFYAVFADYVE